MIPSEPLLDATSRQVQRNRSTNCGFDPLDKDNADTPILSHCAVVPGCTLCIMYCLLWLLSPKLRLGLCVCQELDDSELEESRRRRREASSRDDDE